MLETVSSANRTHIGFFGRMNAGKSSLINCFADQEVSIVSPQAGVLTDGEGSAAGLLRQTGIDSVCVGLIDNLRVCGV